MQWLLLLRNDPAVLVRADADEQVAVLRHDIHEHVHELGSGDDVLRTLIAIGPEGMPHSSRGLPLLGLDGVEDGVLGGVEVVPVRAGEGELLVLLGDVLPEQLNEVTGRLGEGVGDDVAPPARLDPSIVDDALGHAVVVVSEELSQVASGRPRDVVPQHVGGVGVNELAHVPRGVIEVLGGGRHGEHGVSRALEDGVVEGPVVAARVVQAHPHAVGAHSVAHVADDVALRVVEAFARVRDGRRPEPEALVVLRRQDDVSRARARAQVGDRVEVGGVGA